MGFLDLLGRSTGEELKKTAPAVAARISSLLNVRNLESMPVNAVRAFQLAIDPKATSADFIELIEGDDALSARVIRIANSVYFFRGTKAADIEKAVANIGLNELRNLLSATMLRSFLKGKHKVREQLWANAVATAICCRMLSRYAHGINEGEAFLYGLVHDVGKLVMIQKNPAHYEKVINIVAGKGLSFVEAEEKIYEVNHVEVGKWLAEKWNFPKKAIEAITFHHHPLPKTPVMNNTSGSTLVQVADLISHSVGIGHPPHQLRIFQEEVKTRLPFAFASLGLGTAEADNVIKTLEKNFAAEFALYQLEGN